MVAGRLEPIEICKYEPVPNSPYLRPVGSRTVGEVYRELVGRLEAEGMLPEEYFEVIYDPPNEDNFRGSGSYSTTPGSRLEMYRRRRLEAEFPEFCTIACYPVTGCDGHYIHVDAIQNGLVTGVNYPLLK